RRISWRHGETRNVIYRNVRNARGKRCIHDRFATGHGFQLNDPQRLCARYRWKDKNIRRMIIRSDVVDMRQNHCAVLETTSQDFVLQLILQSSLSDDDQLPLDILHRADEIFESFITYQPSHRQPDGLPETRPDLPH